MNYFRVFRVVLLATIFGLFNHSLTAQAQQTTNPTDSAVKVINPIQLSNVGTATEETLTKLREFRNKIKVSDSELTLDSIIPLSLEKIENWQSSLEPEDIEAMKVRQTESIKAEFETYRKLFESWRKSYSDKTEEIVLLQNQLTEMKVQWQTTRDLERQEALPQQVVSRIKDNLAAIADLSKLVSDRNNQLLTNQTELTGTLIYINDVLNAISKVERSYSEQIFAIDMPPLWQVFSNNEDSTTTKGQMTDVIARHKQDLTSFKINYRSNIYWHLFFFAALLILTLFLRNDVNRWSDEKKDEAISYSLIFLRRPLSSTLLVVLLSAGLFYPDVNSDVLNYFYVLLIIPLLRVIPSLLPSINKKYFYGVAFVFFMSQLGDHFSDVIIIERLILLIIDGLSLLILIKLLQHKEEISSNDGSIRWQYTLMIMKIAAIILMASILANIVGNTFFARVISKGTLIMIYGGAIIYTSSLVLRGIFALLIQQKEIARLNMLQNYSGEVKRQLFRGVNWLASLYWIYLTLEGYLIYDSIYEWAVSTLTHEWVIGSVSLSIGSILAFFLTLWISLLLSKFIRFILQDEILTHFNLPRGVPGAISMIVRLTLIFLGFILAFGAAKIDLSNIALIFGALGVGIGFGLQNIFNNLVSGLILAFERPVQVGDIIQISSINIMGEVKDIGIRASIIRTFDGAEVVVPNGNLISNEMINWTLSDNRRRQEIIVGVAYGTDTDKVITVLNSVVPENENVLKDPTPLILFLGFGDSSLNFRVLFWTPFDKGFVTKSEVGVAIDMAFKKEGIVIPFPQRDLHLKSVSEKSTLAKEELIKNKSATSKKE